MGIELRVVAQDLERGVEAVSGAPPVREVGRHYFGGFVDTQRRRIDVSVHQDRYRQMGGRPVVWYCGQPHERALLHRDLPDGVLVIGGEGAGKTRGILAPWLVLRSLDVLEEGHLQERVLAAGCTAPTKTRRGHVLEALQDLCPRDWYDYYVADGDWRWAFGFEINLRSTHKRSEAEGSPIQGYNWVFCGSDEGQDSLDADADIDARGRTAEGGHYRRLVTVTQKDSSRYRAWRDQIKRDPEWHVATITGPDNPFVHPRHWEKMRRHPSHVYERRFLAKDVRSPLATYPDWSREIHVVPPTRFARDVTPNVLAGYAWERATYHLLIGHDPGLIYNTSIFLRAFMVKRVLCWAVVGEFVTERTTQDTHAMALKQHLQREWGLNHDLDRMDPESGMERALVICDPHRRGEQAPDEDEYQSFRKHGLDIHSAEPRMKQVKRRTRIEMVNRLLKAYDGTVRLFIHADDYGQPVATRLVASIEDAKLDQFGRPENVKKDETDTTHPSTALGYALWPFERELRTDFTGYMAGGLA